MEACVTMIVALKHLELGGFVLKKFWNSLLAKQKVWDVAQDNSWASFF